MRAELGGPGEQLGQDQARPRPREGADGWELDISVVVASGLIATLLALSHAPLPADGASALSGGSYGVDGAQAIAVDGTHVWVTNLGGGGASGNGSATEFNADNGGWVQTLSGGSNGFNGPRGIATDSTHVWVANGDSGAGASGRMIRWRETGP
jgi:hypothetical protein